MIENHTKRNEVQIANEELGEKLRFLMKLHQIYGSAIYETQCFGFFCFLFSLSLALSGFYILKPNMYHKNIILLSNVNN